MTRQSDLASRLRALVIMDEVGSDNPLGREAADEISRLTAERDELRAGGKVLVATLYDCLLTDMQKAEAVEAFRRIIARQALWG